ncbi:MAG: dTDP-4-dehydrorhamnose 3,5-epimerase [endosymbiont of Galathealinum brachiosum]|uniref:dTDP-4-dehydrorhamnose 3,5-epimerase n=1 Tax=endosymbiont of Galathealinum brachiosum TaxID=2200906 RepID=A0A370D8H3_9GAMM|nr:MAG: dTDP-4-dehydrorhamnose 3,5-epimerase [endosymbiont of Galathealinum brachiosum]
MKFIPQSIAEIVLIETVIHGDERGYFSETFRQDKFEEAIGYKVNFLQDNESKSSRGILRGLHFQLPPFAQSKLVRVVEGEVLDVAVDIRTGSPTFGQHVSVLLSGENKRQLFIPRGFAHGFVVLSDMAIFSYKVDNYYSAESDRGLAFDDKELDIGWQLSKEELQLSIKDQKQPVLENLGQCFSYGVSYYA